VKRNRNLVLEGFLASGADETILMDEAKAWKMR
jgi:hypothetical protein